MKQHKNKSILKAIEKEEDEDVDDDGEEEDVETKDVIYEYGNLKNDRGIAAFKVYPGLAADEE